eukprot:1860471-Amphidinium_carterae.1
MAEHAHLDWGALALLSKATRPSEMTDFVLQVNKFTGSLPTVGIQKVTAWWRFMVSRNMFAGVLDENVLYVNYIMAASENKLTGSLEALKCMTAVKALDVGANFLGGTLPGMLQYMKALTFLGTALNRLTGSIPAKGMKLAELWAFVVAVNHLAGMFPAEGALEENIGELPYVNINSLS